MKALRFLVASLAFLLPAFAQQFSSTLFQEMQWRSIGPFRGGRTVGLTGIPDQPNVFLIGVNNGGVWKTTDFGNTWHPIFDGQSSGSVGALAIAPSNPDIIYVGSGEGLRRPDLSVGDGIYKSTDGGKAWTHLGLRDGQQIASILVDPRDPNRVYVAVLGHPYGPNAERGVFRSTDGGQNWQKILYKDEDTGAIDLAFDPGDPQKIYAVMWASRRPPWTTGNSYDGPGSGLFVSTDGGDNWRPLTKGLPTWDDGLGRIGITIAPSDQHRMYAMVDAQKRGGVYRSDDAGESWQLVNTEQRVYGRGSDFAWVRVDPKNKDTIYVVNTSTYKSTDAGHSFTAWKGAPGGDDYHAIWINPTNPDIILLTADQGATVTVNGGQTWGSWYNQPTAQFYHVITDNSFPYRVYGAQQESGSVGTASRGDDGEITFREWHPVGVEEYGYVAPDPLNPTFIYGGKVTRYDITTGMTEQVGPVVLRTGKYRFNRTAPLIFSPADPHMLLFGSNVLFKTMNGGNSWEIISPDLTREDPGSPQSLGVFVNSDPAKGKHRGVIYSIAPSPKDVKLIWAGTDDGLIHVTHDGGKTWQNVTPTDLTPWSKVAQLDAGHFDPATAYAAVNRFRLDDLKPYIYRTHDGGKSWQKIVSGIPDEPVNTVREDPQRKGLLFAGTERTVYVSFDDGDHWQSLQNNLPATSIRDLVVHNDDIVVGTHGRSFWILDDITPLRQISQQVADGNEHLFAPETAYRMRRSEGTDTPLPPEVPAGMNPPDGAVIDYYLKAGSGAVAIDILDSTGKLVRSYSSNDKPEVVDPKLLSVPVYWLRPAQALSNEAGLHRWVWNLHYPDPKTTERDLPISAVPHDTPFEPQGPRAVPGQYTIRLTANGGTITQPLTLKIDPRVKVTQAALEQQTDLEKRIAADMNIVYDALQQARSVQSQLKKLQSAEAKSAVQPLQDKLTPLLEAKGDQTARTLPALASNLVVLYTTVDSADAAPTAAAVAAYNETHGALAAPLSRWNEIKTHDIPAANEQLRRANQPAIDPNAPSPPSEEE